MLLTAGGLPCKQTCGDLKGSQCQAVDIRLLTRGNVPQAPAEPGSIVYQAAAGMPCSSPLAVCTCVSAVACAEAWHAAVICVR